MTTRPTLSTTLKRFRPHPLLTVAAILLVITTLKLSSWQFSRAAEKSALEQQAKNGMSAAAVTLRVASATTAITPFQRAAVIGAYLRDNDILLDNRIWRGRAGYHVTTPFLLADGGAVMINRGWTASDGRRDILPTIPTPVGQLTVQGVFYTDNSDAFTLSEKTERGNLRQNLILRDVAKETQLPLMTLILHAENGDNLQAAPVPTDFKSSRSVVYAWQWLTFALLTVVFYLLLGFKRR